RRAPRVMAADGLARRRLRADVPRRPRDGLCPDRRRQGRQAADRAHGAKDRHPDDSSSGPSRRRRQARRLMSGVEAGRSSGAGGSRAQAWVRPLARKFLLARDPGSAAIQSVVLQLLTVAANLVTGVVTARLLGVEGRGVYAAATTWPTVLGSVAVAGAMDAVLVFIRRRPEQTLVIVAWASAAMLVCATLVATIAYVA